MWVFHSVSETVRSSSSMEKSIQTDEHHGDVQDSKSLIRKLSAEHYSRKNMFRKTHPSARCSVAAYFYNFYSKSRNCFKYTKK